MSAKPSDQLHDERRISIDLGEALAYVSAFIGDVRSIEAEQAQARLRQAIALFVALFMSPSFRMAEPRP